MQRIVPQIGLHVDVGPFAEEKSDGLLVLLEDGRVEGAPTGQVGRVDVGDTSKENLDHLKL